ncbi:PLDc N-terminal domain-containing protein [Methanolobus psychrotolerans]|uniref:PLDc N-terminal domain-containing protein n=1 Tax=Methanolobus psychrotolerans TaxID=1874706 RepID=UPI000B91B57C|nr:PLD nuclease N-terminal domain-containing protein [Methanolobus psychrotolerans]
MFDMFFGFSFLMFFLFGIGLLGTLFWLWMLIDCATKEPSEGNDKLIWVIVIIFTHLLGALVYFLVRRPKRIEEYGK